MKKRVIEKFIGEQVIVEIMTEKYYETGETFVLKGKLLWDNEADDTEQILIENEDSVIIFGCEDIINLKMDVL